MSGRGFFWGAAVYSTVLAVSDGRNWQIMPQPPYATRSLASYLVFGNRLLLMGGTAQLRGLTDVWSSADGRTWTQTSNAFPSSGANGTVAIGRRILTVPFGETAPTDNGSSASTRFASIQRSGDFARGAEQLSLDRHSSYEGRSPAQFFMLNQTAPGTAYSLVPPP